MINLKEIAKKYNNQNLWFSSENDTFYLSGFKSSNLNIFLIEGNWYGITDDRYYLNAKKSIKNIKILNQRINNFENTILNKIKNNQLLIDGNTITINQYNYLIKKYQKLKFIPADFSNLRIIKTEDEIKKITSAVKITDQIFEKIFKFVKPGLTELEIKKFIQIEIINSSAQKESFDTIVAAGKNSANPHYESTNYKLKADDNVLIDFGVFYNGYCSDMTRSFTLSKNPSNEYKKVFNVVKKALEIGIKTAKAGVTAGEVDLAVRNFIKDAGYGDYFTHSTGHGIGVDIHETPNIFPNSQEILKENMIITIEPGIYLKNKFGIRLEQDLLIKKNGNKVLNKAKIISY